MITAGLDMGSKTVKAVILSDGKILAQSMIETDGEKRLLAQQVLDKALKQAKLSQSDIKRIGATGAGSKTVPFADKMITVVGADAKGGV